MATFYNTNVLNGLGVPSISSFGNNTANTPTYPTASTDTDLLNGKDIPAYGVGNTAPASTGFWGSVGDFFKGVGDRAGNVIDNIGSWFSGTPTNSTAPMSNIYPQTHYVNPNNFSITPIYDFKNSNAGSLNLLGNYDREAQYQAALQTDPLLAQQQNITVPVSSYNQVSPEDTGAFGWSKDTWRDINAGLELGQLGWNVYSGIQQLSLAKQALAEQQLMNAYNRRLSAFNANTQIDQANQSLKDRLYARQKYATGSTAGAEEIYKDRELQHFGG